LKKILVGVDGSEYSTKALKEAIEIAKRFSAEVTVVNVFHLPDGEDVSKKILNKARVVLEESGIKYNLSSVLSPNTPKVVTDMAEDEKYDLIVVGSRGRGEVKAFMLGSVSHKISTDSPVNVLIVK